MNDIDALVTAALLITLLITIVIAVTLMLTLVGERRELRELRSLFLETVAGRTPTGRTKRPPSRAC